MLFSHGLAVMTALVVICCAATTVCNAHPHAHAHLARLLPHNRADDGYTHAAYLDADQTILFKWSIASSNASDALKLDVIKAQVSAPTLGWLSVGTSPNGGMIGANMLVMWVDDNTGVAHVQDRYATKFAEPNLNDNQTAAVLEFSGEQNATHTIMRFTRWLNAACRSDHDLSITNSAIRVIYAFNDNDPNEDGQIMPHITADNKLNAGSQTIYLLDDTDGTYQRDKEAALADTTSIASFTAVNFSVPAVDTYYNCKFYQLPEVTEDGLNIVGFEPILQQSNLDIIHHFLVHNCYHSYDTPPQPNEFECYNTQLPTNITDCFNYIMWVWGAGGSATYFPQDIAIPLTTKDSKRYILVETHYNNPQLAQGRFDNSGFRILFSNKPRQNGASCLVIGAPVSESVVVPGNQTTFTIPTMCHENCTAKWVPPAGTRAFGAILHSHLIGRSMVLRRFRDGVELEPIASDPTYDFNFQQYRPVNATIMPGDKLIMECNYSSTDPELRTLTTLGGYSTRDEMCYAFIFVSPSIPLEQCSSAPLYDIEKQVLNFTDIVLPPNATYDQFQQYKSDVYNRLKGIDWPSNQKMASDLQDLYQDTPHYWACSIEDKDYIAGESKLLDTWTHYTPPDECKN